MRRRLILSSTKHTGVLCSITRNVASSKLRQRTRLKRKSKKKLRRCYLSSVRKRAASKVSCAGWNQRLSKMSLKDYHSTLGVCSIHAEPALSSRSASTKTWPSYEGVCARIYRPSKVTLLIAMRRPSLLSSVKVMAYSISTSPHNQPVASCLSTSTRPIFMHCRTSKTLSKLTKRLNRLC